jgi:hypothetical protein
MRLLLTASCSVATFLLLVACGGDNLGEPAVSGSQVSVSGRGLTPERNAALAPTHGLIYFDYFQNGQHTPVTFYSEQHPLHLAGVIHRNISGPRQLAADPAGNIYVTSMGSNHMGAVPIVEVYAPGAINQTKTLHIPSSDFNFIYGVCVAQDSTVYVATAQGFGLPHSVYAYANGSTQPTSTVYTYPMSYEPEACAVDSAGNLYVLYWNGSSELIDEFAPGSHTPQTLGITLQSGVDIGFDPGGNMLVSGYYQSQPAVYVYPPGSTTPSRSFQSSGTPGGFALSSSGKQLYVNTILKGSMASAVLVYNYSSGKQVGQFWGGSKRFGNGLLYIAVTPRAP